MKWGKKWLLLLLLVPISIVIPTAVMADTSADVTITASGYVCGALGIYNNLC